MGYKCPYCGSRKSIQVYEDSEEDLVLRRYRCLKCSKIFAILEIKYINMVGKEDVKRLKFKALKLPVEVYDKDGKLVTVITKEDLEKEHQNYEGLYKAFGVMIPHFFDDEYVYYFRDFNIEVNKYYVALYCDGTRYAVKKLF